jgi:hypothetical protein
MLFFTGLLAYHIEEKNNGVEREWITRNISAGMTI